MSYLISYFTACRHSLLKSRRSGWIDGITLERTDQVLNVTALIAFLELHSIGHAWKGKKLSFSSSPHLFLLRQTLTAFFVSNLSTLHCHVWFSPYRIEKATVTRWQSCSHYNFWKQRPSQTFIYIRSYRFFVTPGGPGKLHYVSHTTSIALPSTQPVSSPS